MWLEISLLVLNVRESQKAQKCLCIFYYDDYDKISRWKGLLFFLFKPLENYISK